MKRILPLLLIALMLNACGQEEPNSLQEYLSLAPAEPGADQNPRLQPSIKLYNQLKDASLPEQIAKTYTEKLYYDDAIVTLHNRQDLLKYLQHTQKKVDSIKFKVLSVEEKGDDVFLRWTMHTRFTIMGQSHDAQSIGISHLRFNNEGKIILHQDFWDSMQGFYQHLPIIGGVLRWIKNHAQNF